MRQYLQEGTPTDTFNEFVEAFFRKEMVVIVCVCVCVHLLRCFLTLFNRTLSIYLSIERERERENLYSHWKVLKILLKKSDENVITYFWSDKMF